MAGIAGAFSRRGGFVGREALARQAAALAHRGPASESLWHRGPVGLAYRGDHLRPAICPGDQPLTDGSGRFWIVCDGRIHNADAVAKALSDHGVRVASDAILEVMLQAFVTWGVPAFARFNGAFACAIWDDAERRLLLARDHFGIKPLYYAVLDDLVVFGSEVKGVLAHPACPRAPDDVGIANFLTTNTYLFQAEVTFYCSVRKVQPAHVITADADQVRATQYWRLDPAGENTQVVDDDYVAAVRDLVTDAVRIRMPPGDRLGAALTGGFDSSSIVCLLSHLDRTERGGRAALDTFSFDFDNEMADEIALIRVVAEGVGARHHHIPALIPGFLEDLDDVIRASDGPLVEGVVLLLWRKKRAARAAGVDVLLSGLAGDEIFMGTLHFLADLLRTGRWGELYRQIRSVYPVDPSTGQATALGRLLRAYVLSPLVPEWLRQWRMVQSGRRFPPDWISRALVARTGLAERLPRSCGPRFASAFHQHAWELLSCDVSGGVLPYHDSCSAAFGVETRFPYLDVRLVESLYAVPRTWKVDRGRVRRLQERAMASLLPEAIGRDHVKKSFHSTLHRFMRHACRDAIDGVLARPRPLSREYVEWPRLRAHAARYFSGEVDSPGPLWAVLNLERWLEVNWG